VPATQSVSSEQPIYNPATGTELRTISTFNARSFLINMGNLAFDGWLYAADAINGVFKFYLKTPSSQTSNILKFWAETSANSVGFNNLIGIVIISNDFNQRHENNIVNYFGVRSQNLKHSSNIDIYFRYGTGTGALPLTFGTQIISFPLINTNNTTNMSFTWYGNRNLTSFPLINTQNVTSIQQSWFSCSSLSSFPPINTQNVTIVSNTWDVCTSLTSFPSLNTQNVTRMDSAWRICSLLTQLSLDNILISIAAGFANNIGKTITNVANIFLSVTAILSHQNRRPEADLNETNTQDTISNWNTIIDSYLSNQITLTEMRNQHANAIDTYNTRWKTWEQALRNTNESLNGVQYNFSNGTVSGQKAYYWILAKKSLNIPLGAAPTTLTTGVTRSYRSNSGLTVNGSNVNAWTPVTGTSNQTISGLTTQTINGITCVMFSSTKTITLDFSSINGVTNAIVYIGTLYGYVKRISITATNLKIESTNTTTELPIISIMVTTTAVNETEVLLRLGFYGSFQEFNYTANTLTSTNIQLTAV
jgi:hypothetical protein